MMVYDNSGGDDYWVREKGFNMLNYFLHSWFSTESCCRSSWTVNHYVKQGA